VESTDIRRSLILRGIAASPGINWGRAYVIKQKDAPAPQYKLDDPDRVEREVTRFQGALAAFESELYEITKKIRNGEELGPLFIDIYRMIVKDRRFVQGTEKNIRERQINAEWALQISLGKYRRIFGRMENLYLKERVKDIENVVRSLLQHLSGDKKEPISAITGQVIVIARDLSPADTVQMTTDTVLGFATDMGGKTSHTAIVARSMEIPAVVGLQRVTGEVKTNDIVIVDGTAGAVIINPLPDMAKRYEEKRKHYLAMEDDSLRQALLPAVSRDGRRIEIGANIEFSEDIPSALEHGAEGIGLYRTEFLYINRDDLPTEDEHYQAYRTVLAHDGIQWATIRTFDLGGDKFLSDPKLADEMNPAMGLRAVRYCLREVDLFKVQLRAILRASAYGNARIMFPMISGVQEIREVRRILDTVKTELRGDKIPMAEDIKIGIMIEVPSAVMMADSLAEEVDFFSIGTNDLIQYALAIDRINERVTYLYRPLHPAVLRLIRQVVEAAHAAGITVAMCGEMAGDPLCAMALIGLELDELSMTPLAIPRIKKIIRETTVEEAKRLLADIMALTVTDEIEEYITHYMVKRFPGVCPMINGET